MYKLFTLFKTISPVGQVAIATEVLEFDTITEAEAAFILLNKGNTVTKGFRTDLEKMKTEIAVTRLYLTNVGVNNQFDPAMLDPKTYGPARASSVQMVQTPETTFNRKGGPV